MFRVSYVHTLNLMLAPMLSFNCSFLFQSFLNYIFFCLKLGIVYSPIVKHFLFSFILFPFIPDYKSAFSAQI